MSDAEESHRLQERAEAAPLTWDPVAGGKRAWVCFEDDKLFELGLDADGRRFAEIARRMMTGHYYPPDAVTFSGRYLKEARELRPGDRIVQRAPLFGELGGPRMRSSAEIYLAERSPDACRIGYVTTALHHGRGIWTAELLLVDGHLTLRVRSTASPHSWLFWLGLPFARWLQLRARRRAVEEFLKV